MHLAIFALFAALTVAQQMPTLEQALKDCKECSTAASLLFTPEILESLIKNQPFTLLVPNNQAVMGQQDALQMVPEAQRMDLIKGHILNGTQRDLKAGPVSGFLKPLQVTGQSGNFQIGNAKVIGQYRQAANGNGFWVIDKVLTANSSGTQATASGQVEQPEKMRADIFQLVKSEPELSQINQFIERNPALKQVLTGPLTFFIPNNNAIAQVQQRFSQIPTEKAVDFVRFHIVYGIVPELVDNMRLATLLPTGDLFIKKVGSNFTVNNAKVIGQFHKGSNGQGFYIIDRVLFPDAQSQQGQQNQQGFQQSQPQARPESQPQSQPQAQPESQPQSQPQAQPESQPRSQPEVQPQAQPESQPQVQPRQPAQ